VEIALELAIEGLGGLGHGRGEVPIKNWS